MFAHLRANLWLLFLSLVICCVIYPAAVWVVAQTFFHNQAQGSLINAKGEPVSDPKEAIGSRLIAQQFNSAWFFQPRPSAASYNAAASGGSNYGASNPKLRGRVAQQLGPIVRYTEAYQKAHTKADGGAPDPQTDMKDWYKAQAVPPEAGKEKFDAWLTEQVAAKKLDPLKDFEQVPADMVTTSGSGLDPDISLANAQYQKDTVVSAYAAKLASDSVGTSEAKKKLQDELTPQIGAIVDKLLGELAYRPMFGLTGDKPLVNVLELNVRLQSEAAKLKAP